MHLRSSNRKLRSGKILRYQTRRTPYTRTEHKQHTIPEAPNKLEPPIQPTTEIPTEDKQIIPDAPASPQLPILPVDRIPQHPPFGPDVNPLFAHYQERECTAVLLSRIQAMLPPSISLAEDILKQGGIVAGGCVSAAMMHDDPTATSDVDVFVFSRELLCKILQRLDHLTGNGPKAFRRLRGRGTVVTLQVATNPQGLPLPIQVTLCEGVGEDPRALCEQLLYQFDFDFVQCGICWSEAFPDILIHGTTTWCQEAIRTKQIRYISDNEQYNSERLLSRISRAMSKGFQFVKPFHSLLDLGVRLYRPKGLFVVKTEILCSVTHPPALWRPSVFPWQGRSPWHKDEEFPALDMALGVHPIRPLNQNLAYGVIMDEGEDVKAELELGPNVRPQNLCSRFRMIDLAGRVCKPPRWSVLEAKKDEIEKRYKEAQHTGSKHERKYFYHLRALELLENGDIEHAKTSALSDARKLSGPGADLGFCMDMMFFANDKSREGALTFINRQFS